MAAINIILAITTLVGGLLCGRAFLPHINILGNRPTENLARGLLICALSAFPRTAFWDVLRPTIWLDANTAYVNLTFNGLLVVGIYFILRARYLTIPEDERSKWNIFTAVFYPKNIIPRLRKDE